MNDLKGSVCVVTGGSRGFGAGIARQLVQAGACVWVTGRDAERLRVTACEIGATPFVADATRPEDWERLRTQLLDTHGRWDVLVNNAGAGVHIAPLVEQSEDDVLNSVSINLTASLLGSRVAAQVMQPQRSGTIINISSVCAQVAWPGWSVYSACKAGLVQFGKCLYAELRPARVRITTVIPSWGATDFTTAPGLSPRDAATLERCIQPADLGDLVVSICQLPDHLAIQDVTLWPLVQELESL